MSETLTVKEVAGILGYSTNSIYTFLKEGRLKGVRLGKGRFRIPKDEIEKLVVTERPENNNNGFSKEKSVFNTTKPENSILSGADIGNPHLSLGNIRLGAPNLFDIFVGITSVLVGFTMFLFSTSMEKISLQNLMFMITPLKITFILAGAALILSDMVRRNGFIWKSIFTLFLICAYSFLAYLVGQSGDTGGTGVYLILVFVMVTSLLLRMSGTTSILVYILLLLIFGPVIPVIFPEATSIPFYWRAVTDNWIIYILFWLIFSTTIILSLWHGFKRNSKLLWIMAAVIGIGFIWFSVWYALYLYWVKAIFLLMSGFSAFFLVIWNTFNTCEHDENCNNTLYKMFISVLLLFAATIAVFKLIEVNVFNDTEKDLKNTLSYGQTITNNMLEQSGIYLESIAQNPFFVETYLKSDDTGLGNLTKFIYTGNKYFRKVAIINPAGKIIKVYPFDNVLEGKSVAFRDYMKDVLSKKKTIISDEFVSQEKVRTQSIAIVTPVSKDGKIIAVVAGALNLDYLSNRLREITDYERGEIFVIVDKNKNLILSGDHKPGNEIIDEPVILGLAKESGVKNSLNSENQQIIQAYGYIENTGWAIGAEQALSKVLMLSQNILIVIYISSLIIGVLIVWVSLILHREKYRFS